MISWPFINYCLLAIMADWSITVSNRYGHYSYQKKRLTYQGNNSKNCKAKQCSVCLLLPFVFQPFQLHPKPDISDGNQIVWYIRIVYLKCISIPSQCQHVFLTFAHRKKMTSNLCVYAGNLQQKGVMVVRKKQSRVATGFISRRKQTTVRVVMSVKW